MSRLRAILLNLLVWLLTIAVVLPLVWMVLVSFMPTGASGHFPPPFWPARWTLTAYRELLTRRWYEGVLFDYHFLPALWNSVFVAIVSTGLGLLLTVPAGYAFAKLRFRGRERLLQVLIASLVIPGQVAMLPLFLMFKEAGLVNSYTGVILPSLAAIFAVLFVRQRRSPFPTR